ncbi:hypothetical protein [Mycobacterium simiae]|nr:hypothetical protein [Mycobacterium simiae]
MTLTIWRPDVELPNDDCTLGAAWVCRPLCMTRELVFEFTGAG